VPLYVTETEVGELLAPADALDAVEACFRRLAAGEIENVPRQRTPFEDGVLAVMWAVDRELELAGLKTYAAGHEGESFVVVLFETASAKLAGVIEADKLGQLRTGAASGVAAKYLAKAGAASLGVIGCGWQARSQVACIREALPSIERVVAYCRNDERLAAFCRETGAEAGESHRDPAGQDVVVTITTSRDPVLRGEWLQPGALVCAAGANHHRRRELDNAVLERAAFVCCDSIEQAKRESGDLIEPVEAGVLDWLEVHELQEVVAGELPGRQQEDDIVVFKSNGLAAWDVAVGSVVLERARERGVGTEV
jgi:ornithine cyclodeaminase/alanine dehydrogenase-like protein (mu-crystallin family)